MQISAKATFLGFAQDLDQQTGRLKIAGVEILLTHTDGARTGDVLQVDAVRDQEGIWSGVVTARLTTPEVERSLPLPANKSAPEPSESLPGPSTSAARQRRFAEVNGAAPTSRPAGPGALAAPTAAPAGRRFNVNSTGPRTGSGTHTSSRPQFIPTAADERVRY